MDLKEGLCVHFMLLAFVALLYPADGRSIFNQLPGLEDTIVDIGGEPATGHRLVKRSPLVAEIMGPLSRNVRQVDEAFRSRLVYKRMRILLTLLRMRLGRSPEIEILQFNNWDKTIQVDQLFFVKPKTIWEVRRVILAARSLGMRVRATGAGHSRSPLYVDEGNIMMDMRELQRHDGPFMELNAETPQRNFKTVTAMTGAHMFELNEFMTQEGVTILTEPLNDQETLGGMVAAGSHGSTYDAPAFPGIVVELRLMDALGRLRKFTMERQPDLMRALSLNLGTFGIMYDITIRVKTISGSNENCLWIRTINEATPDDLIGQPIQGPITLSSNGSLSGGSTVGLLRAKGSLNLARQLPHASFHYLVNAFPIIEPPRYGSETSAAFLLNIDTDFDRPYRAIKYLVEKTEHQIKTRGTTPMNALLPRFFRNSNCYLCFGNTEITMPEDNGHSVVVDFLAPPTQDGFYAAAADFVNQFKNESIRPHWAKRHDNIDGIIDLIQDVYKDLIPAFMEQKRLAMVDPCDMFMNSYLIAIFGRSPTCYYY
ncbi:D-arabinono-1,4-lactone oxidase-like [Plakobranchus ocellatus]|uniref:D-arabinono-1,4-lactone oxidase-like n=1 Tax=Plakobranchus ocellatus TaxID=259542 RepID=A0AAV3ZG12_9GAST|nr:D-arabinono-1,4-lactone oxidase-like [Plakobranchus ocellatus]